jgi:hypothetical protein
MRRVLMSFLIGAVLAGVTSSVAADRVRSSEVEEAEQRLSELGYFCGPVDGALDAASRHALIAFQKVEGRRRTGQLDDDVLAALRVATRPLAREGGDAHVEVDLERQVLFLVDATGAAEATVSVSTGNGKYYNEGGMSGRAFTPRGRFVVERKIAGWRRSPLGRLYYPIYFLRGWAIHGSSSVPVRPASHGCVRVPIFASKAIFEWAEIGMPVIVY